MWTWHFKLFTHHMKSKQKLLLSKVETLKKICKDREIDFCWLPTWFLLIGQLSSLICTRHWILENHGATFVSLCESVQEFVVCWMITLNIVVFLLQRSSVSAGAASLGPWIFHLCQQLQSDAVTPDQGWETRLKLVSPTAPHHHTIISNNNSFRLSNSSSRESAWLVQLKLKCMVQKWQLTLSYHNWCWEFSDN